MNRITYEGNFCDIARCFTPGGWPCKDGMCSQRRVWERLKYYEDLQEQGRMVELPCTPNEEVWIGHDKYSLHRGVYPSRSAILSDMEDGYVIGRTREEAEALLKGEGK